MRDFLRRLLGHPSGIIAGTIVLIALVLAVIAPPLWGQAAATPDAQAVLLPSSLAHPLGTDQLGRDVLLRTLVATSLSMSMTLAAVVLGSVLGIVAGAAPTLFGPRVQRAASGVINMWLAFPMLLIAMFLIVLIGNTPITSILVLAMVMAPVGARVTQTLALKVAGSEYVAAARLLGVGRARLLLRYIIPNIAEPLIVNITLGFGTAMLALSSLSFLGIGVQPPAYDWGRLLSEGFAQVYSSPLAVLGPGTAVVLVGLAFGALGEGVAAALRDSSRSRRRLVTDDAAPSPQPDITPSADAVLFVRDLRVSVEAPAGRVMPVPGVSFQVRRGEIVGIVGESGSGKSLTTMAIADLLPLGASSVARQVVIGDRSIPGKGKRRQPAIGVIFQDSLTALNPSMTVGAQLREVARYSAGVSRQRARRMAVDALADVGIDSPEKRVRQYPHEFSGGMRQRVSIAMATMADPALLIADEPTTALDVTVQRRVLNLLRQKAEKLEVGTLIVSHDIGALAEVCDRILVMYAGRIVEACDVQDLSRPGALAHPYARALVQSFPTLQTDRSLPLATIPGDPPAAGTVDRGCPFAPRCHAATERCRAEEPPLLEDATGRKFACWHPQNAEVLA